MSEEGDPDEPLGDLARRVRERRDARRRRDGSADEGDEGDGDDPGDVTDEVEAERGGLGGADDERAASAEGDELFEEMDVADVDTDAVWESVLTDEGDDERADALGADIDPTEAVESTVGDDHIVPKGDYCESCHFFSAPPAVACSYDGAAVVEVVDREQFRVRNCPVVEGIVDTDGTAVPREGTSERDLTGETPSD
ncbi:hypothetical protein [Salinigranum halophilum]|jgi:hypothetical protein|uniref:hypothetical protein n=1 Tax=Salinigranum halophilum TaxID=2565931 RepID=UPI00115EDF1B|nr:hypothetical protein [Salinigranum halophilum]